MDTYEIPKEEFGPRVAQEIKANARKLGIELISITRIGIAVQIRHGRVVDTAGERDGTGDA